METTKRTVTVYKPTDPGDLLSDRETPFRVFVYCRVSTDQKDQINSLATQMEYFQRLKNDHPNWIDFEIFSDKGISGTSLKNRDDFNRMIAKAMKGEVDLIITKEVSRFSRNLKDTLNVIDDLRKRKVTVYFLSQRINSMVEADYQRLCTLANMAQEESYNTSLRVRFGQQTQMERGVTFGRKEMFGYRIEKNEFGEQTYVIIEEEAEIIRRIYEWFKLGDGTHRIARRLEAEGIKTLRYSNGWSNTVILRILRNEKYVGDLLQGKTYTPRMLEHGKKYNRGESYSCYIENHHTPIVDRETWNEVQKILEDKAPSEEQKIKHSNRYWLSGKVFCGVCGGRFISKVSKKKTCIHKAWVCLEAQQRGIYREDTIDGVPRGCNSGGMINDRLFQILVHDLIVEYIKRYKDNIIADINNRVAKKTEPKEKKTIDVKKLNIELEEITSKVDKLLDLLLSGTISEDIYKRKNIELLAAKQNIEKQLREAESVDDEEAEIKALAKKDAERIEALALLENVDFDEDLYGRITKKIVVYPEHIIEIHITGYSEPIIVQFKAKGKLDKYTADFEVLSREEAMRRIGDKINNRVGGKKPWKKETTENISEE